MTETLSNPIKETWFICWDDKRTEIKAYSSVPVNTRMDTYWRNVDYYTTEKSWKDVLLANGIDIL